MTAPARHSAPATEPLVLVDGSSWLFRAYHALPPLTNSRGEPTGAIYGVVNMLRRLPETLGTRRIAVVFDTPGPTFREAIYDKYKANRPAMPEDLAQQIEPLHTLIRALGFPLLAVPGVEADDVIGTLALQATRHDRPVIISTADKDFAQLVRPGIRLANTMTGIEMDDEGVREKFGVMPAQIVDYLTLVGDAVDNVPGVRGVGPKTAAKWLSDYGTLDNLVAHADEISGKAGEALRAALPDLERSRTLVTIHCEVPLDTDAESIAVGPPDRDTLRTLFARLEFKSWLAQLESPAKHDAGPMDAPTPTPMPAPTPAPPVTAAHYETVLTDDALERWIARLAQAPLFAFDTETTSLDRMSAEIVGVSFAVQAGEAAYVPLAHRHPGTPAQLDREHALARLKPLLESARHLKVGQNLKYDLEVLANHGIALDGIAHDTMLESYVLDSTATRHDMDSLAERYLSVKTIRYEDVCGKGAKQIGFDQVAVDEATRYAAEDADITLRLHERLWPALEAEPKPAALYRELELPLIPVLARMERRGVLVDARLLQHQSAEIAGKLLEIEEKAAQLAGTRFNLASPKQIQDVLYVRQGLPVLRKTPTGQPSTAEEVLEELAPDYPLPALILEFRSLARLKSAYCDALPQQIHPRTGRVHTSFHQAVAATGRLSSSDPNLQNIPVRTAEGRRIRQAFVAPEGCVLISADYSQIELRIMAHLSRDAGLLNAFARGEDIHRATAAEMFARTPDAVSSDERRAAKAINFGLIYGMTSHGLARQLGTDRAQAQAWIDRYFERYPGVLAYMETTRQTARDTGYVETIFGRRLHVPDIRARNAQQRQYAERAAINAPMQGSAADIIKRAMLAVDGWLLREKLPAHMILQVHDELVLEVAQEAVDTVQAMLVQLMEKSADLAVPLVVDAAQGANWEAAH